MSIVQVARRAGVSAATVSRVLNDLPGVRDETKVQVRAAAEALKYVTPLVKRGPKPGSKFAMGTRTRSPRRAGTIAVIVVGNRKQFLFEMPVIANAFGGITRAATQNNLKVLIEEMWDFSKPSQLLVDREVDGVIAFLHSGMKPADFRESLTTLQQHVPVVWAMGGDAGVTAVDHIIPDDRAISQLAFNCLIENNCTNIAFLTQNPSWAMMRNRGHDFAGLAHDAGMNWSAYLVSEDAREGELFGARAVVTKNLEQLVDRIADASPRPDGIFIGNDATTALVHPMLLRRGIQPGKDILLVSCDNEQIRLDGLMPRPLSIDIGSAEVGAVAVRRLCFRMEHNAEPPVLIKVAPFVPPMEN